MLPTFRKLSKLNRRNAGKARSSSTAAVELERNARNIPIFTNIPQQKSSKQTQEPNSLKDLSNEELVHKIETGKLKQYKLESELEDPSRAVEVRRSVIERNIGRNIENIPYKDYDYSKVMGKCCENVIGFLPIPLGVISPLKVNGREYSVPMATTEGALLASTQRGCHALTRSGGVNSHVMGRGMTRAPCVQLPNARRAVELKNWLEDEENYKVVEKAFNSSSRFARLEYIKTNVVGRNCYVRFRAPTGDAMGMNMISKGVEQALSILRERFPEMKVLSLSGNFCTDKKPSAVNWIEGRGVSVVADAVVKGDIVKKLLKTNIADLCDLNVNKNLIGSAASGSIGGFNAHASNIVSAVFLATGQDVAQNVESSNCITLMEPTNDGKDLYVSVTMPSIEVGTVGGGTILPAQTNCLNMLDVDGASTGRSSEERLPGRNVEILAEIIAASVMAGELSLMSALSSGDLVKSHLKLNRGSPKK